MIESNICNIIVIVTIVMVNKENFKDNINEENNNSKIVILSQNQWQIHQKNVLGMNADLVPLLMALSNNLPNSYNSILLKY